MEDPDEQLTRLRELVSHAAGVGWGGNVFLLDEIASRLRDLDQSLSRGGPLPTAWARPVLIIEHRDG